MAKYDKYDPRLETLVVETRTKWDPAVADLLEEEKRELAERLHRQPQLASKIFYHRVYTGVAREITVTPEDVEKLRQQAAS